MSKKLGVAGILAVLMLLGTTSASQAGNTEEPRPGLKTEKMKARKARRPIPPNAKDSWAARDLKKDGYDPKTMTGKDIREMMGGKD